jgi:hypothetical protein
LIERTPSTKVDGVPELTVPDPDDPAAALAAVVALRRLADRLERAAVARAMEQGWTWVQVAEALGVTPQAAHKRLAGGGRETRTRRNP